MPDKFKGTLTARAAAEAIAGGWRRARPQDSLVQLPISDGGDGFGELLGQALPADVCWTETINAAQEPHRARWWWHGPSSLAVIESAQVIGLALLPPGQFHPFALDTYGLGAVLRAAQQRGARRVLMGIGGSATNDGGFGLARACGWKFLDASSQELGRWTELIRLARIVPPKKPISGLPTDASAAWTLEVAVDVRNPLLGQLGATRVYGPQKGLTETELAPAEACLARLAEVVRAAGDQDIAAEPGTGAAGGLGFGLRAFLGAELKSGFDLFFELTRLEHYLAHANLVVTGEGAIDASTLMGKGVGELLRQCQHRGIPCVGLAGVVNQRQTLAAQFDHLLALSPDLTDAESSRTKAAFWLAQAAEKAAERVSAGSVP